MNGKLAILALLLFLGAADALWVYTEKGEYLPMEEIRIAVSDGKGTVFVEVFDEEGEQVYYAARVAKKGEQTGWGYIYYPPEEFSLSLESGKYAVEARDESGKAETSFRVSSIGIAAVLNGEGKGVFLHKENGAAIQGGKITLYYNKTGEIEKVEASSGQDGQFSFETRNLTRIIGEYGGESAEIEIYNYGPWFHYDYYPYHYEQYSSYVFSDKSLYQPGETARISSVILLVDENRYETVSGPFEVTVRGPDYNVLYSARINAVNSRVSFDFPIGGEAALGSYSVEIRRNETTYAGWYSFQVQEYKRPEIRLVLLPAEETFELNKAIRINVSSEYYFGGKADAEVRFEIYRSPYYWPYFRCGYGCFPPYWGEEKVAEGLIYSKGGVGEILWDGANQTGEYRVNAWATDESEIRTEAEVSVSVLEKANFDAVFPEMEINESGLITVLAYGKGGEPLDLEIEVRIYTEEWNYPEAVHWEKDDSGRREPTLNRALVFEKTLHVLQGQASFEFTPHGPGSYVLEMEGEGHKGKKEFYVSEWGWWNYGQIKVELDKAEYAQGEMMEVSVTSPKGGKLFVVSMGYSPSINVYLITPGKTKLRMPAVETSSMEFFLVDGGKRHSAYANYMVRGNEWIEVEIESMGKYRPGDAARIIISAKKGASSSNAVASLAIVDQSIMDLSGAGWNDIYEYFYGYPREQYRLLFSWDYYGGIRPVPYKGGIMLDYVMVAEAAPGAPSEWQAAGRGDISIRKKFPETAFWIPYIILEEGKKEIIWHIPDTLTTWNVTVVANEGINVGMGSSAIVVTKDVIGRMSPPPALVEGDAAAIPATVFNYGKERKTFTVTLEASSNIEIIGSPKRYLSIEPDSYMSVDFPVKAVERGDANLTLWVEGGEGDAVLLPIKVKPLGVEIKKGESGVLEGTSAEVKYSAPDGAEVSLLLYSSVLSSAFGSLDYLVSYPYGCLEQTMSGFLPTVVLLHTTEELGLEYTGDANISGIIDDGLVGIYSFQNPDGSWGWFRGNDERISAYVMDGLRIARETGVEVDEGVYSKGKQWLSANAKTPYGKFVLNRLGGGAQDPYTGDAFGALSQCENGKCDALVSMLECAGEYCSLAYDGEVGWYHSETELTSYAVGVLVENGKMEDARKCVNWIMLSKQGRYWVSTKDTALSVLALSSYAKKTGELRSDYVATVLVDSRELFSGRLGHSSVGVEEISLPAGWHTLSLQKEGSGPLYYTIAQRYYSLEIPEGDWEVERKYDKTVAKVGDEIIVTLKVKGRGQYVAIEDPIPLGAEIIKQEGNAWRYYGDWWYGGYRMEARQDRAVFFFDRMDNPEITYRMRVTHKGDFTALPAHAYNMYAPEVGGYSEFQHFTFYQKAYIEPYITEYNTTLRVHWEGSGDAVLRVKAGGVESEHSISPGENEIVVGPGELSYVFESEEEYYEFGKKVHGVEGQAEGDDSLLWAGALALAACAVAIYFWRGKLT